MKRCSKCGEVKPATTEHFNRLKGGLQSWCKECKRADHLRNKEHRNQQAMDRYYRLHPKAELPEGFKRCCRCGVIKPSTLEHFGLLRKTKDGFKHQCRECVKAYYESNKHDILRRNKERYEANKEKVLEGCRLYRLRNAEQRDNYNKRYYAANRDAVLAACRRYKAKHQQQRQAKDRDYYKRNSEKIKSMAKEYYAANKDALRANRAVYAREWNTSEHGRCLKRLYQHRRNNLKRGLMSTLTAEQWEECLIYFDHSCAYCGDKEVVLHQEHVLPVLEGGPYTRQNIIPACPSCNSSKGAKSPESWYESRDFYDQKRHKKIQAWMGVCQKRGYLQLAMC